MNAHNIRTLRTLGLAATAAVLALTGCGTPNMSGSGTTAGPATPEQSTTAPSSTPETVPPTAGPDTSPTTIPAAILIKDFKYQGTETVGPGTEITVTNEDSEAHTITADTDNAFDAVAKVGTATFTAPTEPGTYTYHCIFHGNMKGTLTVK